MDRISECGCRKKLEVGSKGGSVGVEETMKVRGRKGESWLG